MKTTYKINGMSCSGCANGVKLRLEKVEGVKSADISLEDASGVIDADSVTLEDLQKALSGTSYSITEKG